MSSTRRARRMARNHRRMAKPPKLNLVALMDIFTILVLFLIVNNGDVEVLQPDRLVALPESLSEQRPEATLVIKITPEDILLGGAAVASVEDAAGSKTDNIAPLVDALRAAARANPAPLEQDTSNGRPVIIMGDRDIPYAVLKRVMASCAETDFRDIALAVNSVPGNAAPPADEATLAGLGL